MEYSADDTDNRTTDYTMSKVTYLKPRGWSPYLDIATEFSVVT